MNRRRKSVKRLPPRGHGYRALPTIVDPALPDDFELPETVSVRGVPMTTIPDASIEAARDALLSAYEALDADDDSRAHATRDATTAVTAALPHLTSAPQAEEDVREGLARALQLRPGRSAVTWESLPEWSRELWRESANAVLSSGLIVPVGEVERLKGAALDEIGKATGETINALGDLDRVRRERDAALAAVEAVQSEARKWLSGDPAPEMGRAMFAEEILERIDALATLDAAAATDAEVTVMCPNCTTPQDCGGPHLPSLAVRPIAVPARLLSGEHVGREVVLPDGTGGRIIAVHQELDKVDLELARPEKDPPLAPDDVVTLVDEEGGR